MGLEALVNNYIVEDDDNTAFSVAGQISETSSLLDIVRGLEDPLTQEDAAVRTKATQCLTDVIKHKKTLLPQELAVLATFLVDRLEDFASVGPAADGLAELAARPGFYIPEESFWAKLRETNMLDLDQPARYKIYVLLDRLSSQKASDFVPTFVMLASGEKDPQNLMVSLKISRLILEQHGKELAREQCAELYDITFCYFPITFNPPKDMPIKITADDIRKQLRAALVSPAIAEWVVPGLISKLTAVSVSVKVDALVTLDAVAQELKKSGELTTYWKAIWDGTRYEILHGTTQSETYEPSVTLLSRLVDIPEFIEALSDEFKVEELAAGKLTQLCNLVVGVSTSESVWDKLAPLALDKAMSSPELLNLFLAAPYQVPFADRVLQELLVALANGQKKDSTEGLKLLVRHDGEYAPLIVQTLTQEKAYSALAELAQTHSDAIKEHCLPQLLSELPGSLEALGEICCVRPLVHVLTVRLLSRLNLAEYENATALLDTLVESSGHLKSTPELTGYNRVLVNPLLEHFATATEAAPEYIVDTACVLLERAARGVPLEYQESHKETVLPFLGKVHYHLILSALVAMKAFPFSPNFVTTVVLPHLSASNTLLERSAYLRTIALAANKWPENLQISTDQFKQGLEAGDLNALESFAWATKGLLYRADKQGFENARFLTQRVESDPAVARVYGVLMAPDRLLTKENGCIVRALFRQRVFVENFPILSPKSGSPDSLVALSVLLKYSPQSVVATRFSEIFPLLLASLDIRSPRVQAVALQSLCDSLPESSPTIEPYLDRLVPDLLQLATYTGTTDVRVTAIQTLIALEKALGPQLEPYKEDVLDKLVPALGDKKRDVRKYAVICRQAFF